MRTHRARRFYDARKKILEFHTLLEFGVVPELDPLWQGAGFSVEAIPPGDATLARRRRETGWGADRVVYSSAPGQLSWLARNIYQSVLSGLETDSLLNHAVGGQIAQALVRLEGSRPELALGSPERGRMECHMVLRTVRSFIDALERSEAGPAPGPSAGTR